MSDQGTDVLSPVGRIVWGHPGKPRQKTDNNNQVVRDDQGQPVMEVAFGLAIPKDQFEAQLWPSMYAEISKGFPNGIPGNFSYKYVDGDGVDKAGKPYSERPGYAGCHVLAITTSLQPPGIYKFEGNAYRQMNADEVKTGDYARVDLNLKVNVPTNRSHTPSIYVNPKAVEFVGYGKEIQSGGFNVDPNQAFGGQQVQLPPGASATPVGGQPNAQMPGTGPQQQQAPGGMPGNGQMPGAAPAGAPPSNPTQPGQPGGSAAPMSHSDQQQGGMPGQAPQQPQGQPGQMPPPAQGFIPGQQPQQPGGMPGQQPAPQQPQGQSAPGGMPQMPPR